MPSHRLVPLLLALLTALAACTESAHGSTASVTPDGTVLTAADGYLPDGDSLSPSADVPAVSNLRPDLRAAIREAARAAAEDGVDLRITSGWRSAALQQALFDQAVVQYGSAEAARAYVLTPDESDHVTGSAVDVGPTDATSWLQQHGDGYGLCQTYGNEPWHFELATTPGRACPPPLTDARAG